MKTIFTLFASLFMSVAVFAAARPQSILSIKSADRTDIKVVLDGKRFESSDNSIMIRGIENGRHNIKVYKQKRNGIFNILGKGFELVYNSTIQIRNNTHMVLTVERNGRVAMQETRMNGNRDDHRNGRGFDFDRDGHWGDFDHNEAYVRAMNDREFQSVLNAIEKEWLESNKLKSATQIVKANNLTTAQVEQMLLLFSFESNRLDLAKQAYANTVDKRNYHRLYDVFSFNSSRVELERFVEGRNTRY